MEVETHLLFIRGYLVNWCYSCYTDWRVKQNTVSLNINRMWQYLHRLILGDSLVAPFFKTLSTKYRRPIVGRGGGGGAIYVPISTEGSDTPRSRGGNR